jgi:hypothetical protein
VYSYNPIGKRLVSGELRWQLEEDTLEYPARIARDGHSGYPSTASGRCSRPGSSRVGEQTETGRWRIPQSVVHALLEQRREQERLRVGPESVRELRLGGLSRELGRSEARPERTEQAESSLREERGQLQAELEAQRAERQHLAEAMGKGP